MNIVNPDALAICTIWQEAQGESYLGKIAVGEVIRNRMLRNYASDGSVPGTVCRAYQFSAWNDDKGNNALLIKSLKIDDSDPVVVECQRAWFESAKTHHVGQAVLYCNLFLLANRPEWARDDKLVTIVGAHHFYRDP